MKLAYLDARSGLSGDMWLAALFALGWDPRELTGLCAASFGAELHARELAAHPFPEWTVRVHDPAAREFSVAEQRELLARPELPAPVRERARAALERLARAEAEAHAVPVEQVHFHELARLDTVVDLLGVPLGLHRLGIDRIVASPLELGSGTIETGHGVLPVPPPAVARLLIGLPITAGTLPGERTTPTGAALAATLVDSFDPLPPLRLERTGYGRGERPYAIPSRVGLLLGAAVEPAPELLLLETNLDDVEPRVLAATLDRLLAAGARDAWLTPIVMKKGRAAQSLSVLAAAGKKDELLDLIFRELPTFGIRFSSVARATLDSATVTVATPWGAVRVRVGSRGGETLHATPEYEDCLRLARDHRQPLQTVIDAAAAAARGAR